MDTTTTLPNATVKDSQDNIIGKIKIYNGKYLFRPTGHIDITEKEMFSVANKLKLLNGEQNV